MNKKKIRNYQIFSIIFTFILGSILHFTYSLSNKNPIVAIFSCVNESVWEHTKLLYFPMILTLIIGYFYIGKNINNFICSKTIGILISLIFMISFFYTYTGILAYKISIVDISSFFISVILGEYVSYNLIINKFKCNKLLSIIILIVLFICFVSFTFNAPHLGIFKDPITYKYGV